MGGGFGALAAMNEAIKKNREMLKGKKRKSFEKDVHYYSKRGEALVIRGKRLTDLERSELVRTIIISRKQETQKQIIALVISFAVVSALVISFLYLWQAYQS